MSNIDIVVTKTVTKKVSLSSDKVEEILEDFARRELGFENPDVSIEVNYDMFQGALISSVEKHDDTET